MDMNELDLRLRKALEALKEVPPRDPERARAGKMAFLDLAQRLQAQTHPSWGSFLNSLVVPFAFLRRLKKWSLIPNPMFTEVKAMPVLAAIVMFVSLLVGGAVTVQVADAAAPGDPLYVVDVTVEQIQLAFTRSPEKRAELLMRFTQERLEEIRTLEAKGRTEQVAVAAQRLERHLDNLERTAIEIPPSQRTQVMQQIQQLNQVSQTVLQALPAPTPAATATPAAATTPAPGTTQVALSGAPSASKVEFVGTVDSMDATQWVVSGQTVLITAQTEIKGNIQVGSLVKVEGWNNGDGTFTAKEIEVYNEPDKAGYSEFTGTVESMDGDQWIIDGLTVIITADTKIDGNIQVGDVVKVEAFANADGTFTAKEIERYDDDDALVQEGKEVEFTGTVESMDGDQWVIDGQTVIVAGAKIEGNIQVGDVVKVEAYVNADGTLTAKEIELAKSDDSDDDSYKGAKVEFTGTVESMDGDQWVIDGQTVIVAGAKIEGNIQVGDVVKVEAYAGADGTLTAKEIELAKSDDSSSDDDDSYKGAKVKFTGTVESMNGDQWVIDGQTIIVSGAKIKGNIQVGDVVKVEAWDNGGALVAEEIELVSGSSDDSSSDDRYDDEDDDSRYEDSSSDHYNDDHDDDDDDD